MPTYGRMQEWLATRGRRGAWRWSVVPLGLALGAAAAWQAPGRAGMVRTAAAAPAPAGYTASIDRLLTLQVRVVQSRTVQGRDQLDYEVQVAPTKPARTTTKYTYELVSAQGSVAASGASPTVVLPAGGSPQRGTITTPAALADGYYLLRVAAAGSSANGTHGSLEQQYIAMAQGRITTLDADEWFARSGANRARVIRSSFQPRTEEEARTRYAAKETP